MTAQIADKIIIKGVKYSLYTTPLDNYWTKKNPKPGIQLPDTSCWRGYVATWEIFDNNLYLIDIEFHTPKGDVGISYLFPNNTGNIKADWYTGELRIPFGEPFKIDRDWVSLYDSDLFFIIKKGKVINHRYKANY
jgi:hypothetical protein